MQDCAAECSVTGILREIERVLLADGILHIQRLRERRAPVLWNGRWYEATYIGVPYGDGSYEVTSVKVVPRDNSAPVPSNDDDDAPGGAKARGVAAAITALWPDGLPTGLAGKDRDRKVGDWLAANGYSVPADVSKAVRRSLAPSG